MGLFGGSRKNTTTQTTNQQTNILTESGALGITNSSGITIERADVGAIENIVDNAFAFGGAAIEANRDVSLEAIDGILEATDNSLHFAAGAHQLSTQFAADSRESSYIFAGEATAAANRQVAEQSEFNRIFLGEAFGAGQDAIFQAAGFAARQGIQAADTSAQRSIDSTLIAAAGALQGQINTTDSVIASTGQLQQSLITRSQQSDAENRAAAQTMLNTTANALSTMNQQTHNTLAKISDNDSMNFGRLNDSLDMLGANHIESQKLVFEQTERNAQRQAESLIHSANLSTQAAAAATDKVARFSNSALAANNTANQNALAANARAFDSSFEFAAGAFGKAFEGVESSHAFAEKGLDAVIRSSESSTQQITGDFFDLVKWGVVAVAAIFVLPPIVKAL